MARAPLSLWLYGIPLALVEEPKRGELRITYRKEASDALPLGSSLLSTSMPFNPSRRPRGDIARGWLDALLPEGERRYRVCQSLGVPWGDNFGLLEAIGADSAGAVVLLGEGETPVAGEVRVEPLLNEEIAVLLRSLEERPLGASAQLRVSLAGVQNKLLLAQGINGELGRPLGGMPSTVILKPQDRLLANYTEAEAFCMRAAHHLGLTSVRVFTMTYADVPTLVVPRYDRRFEGDRVVRIHQEDATQALGMDLSDSPARKYEGYGGASLRQVAGLLRRFASLADVQRLLSLTTFNVVIGNADAHARNLSLLHHSSGEIELAPAYDLTPTTYYRGVPAPDGTKDMSDELGMFIGGCRTVHGVSLETLVEEGERWGLDPGRAATVVGDTLEKAQTYLLSQDATGLPEEMLDFFLQRINALQGGQAASHGEPLLPRGIDVLGRS